jgi:succinate-acetate transporter protein
VSDRTDRLLAVLVMLLAVLVVSQTTVVPRNQLLGTIGLLVGAFAIVFALAELVNAF